MSVMDKLEKLRSLITEEKDIDWLFSHKTREIHELQSYTRGIWDDNASRYLWKRFATPFENDTTKILPEKALTIERSLEITTNSQLLFENCIKVHTISEEISALLKDAEREQSSSAQNLSDGQKYYEKVEHLMPQVDGSIDSLNNDQKHFQELLSRKRSVYSSR